MKVERLEKSLKVEESRAFGAKIATIVVPAFLLFVYVGAHIQGGTQFQASDIEVFLFFTAIPAAIWGYSVITAKSRKNSVERARDDLNKAMGMLQGRDISIIPPAYRHRQAMTFFYDALYNQKAMTMQEAVIAESIEAQPHCR